MATYKKNNEVKNTVSEAIFDSALYGKLIIKERAALSRITAKPAKTTKDILLANQPSLNKVFNKLLKALSSDKTIEIPSQDYVDQFIDKEKLKIDTVFIDKKHDHLFFVLNNGFTIQEKISKYPLLKGVNEQKLKNYNLYAGGTCIEWEELDEDLSLRGLLKDTVFNPLLKTLKSHNGFVLATE